MGRETVLFKSEEKKSRSEIAAFLRTLADKVEQGRVSLIQAGEELALDLPETLTLEIKAEEESKGQGASMSLEVELEWRPGSEGTSGGVTLG
jgi:amphi-Trp domain-containing protein